MKRITTLTILAAALISSAFAQGFKVTHTDAEWKKLLPPASYNVLRHAGTENAYTGKYWDNHSKGTYSCLGCQLVLFSSDAKYDSKTGWPSFYQEIAKGRTILKTDDTYGMHRTEVLCARCGGHLGHLFEDGPKPTGLRYCMNSVSMDFKPAKAK